MKKLFVIVALLLATLIIPQKAAAAEQQAGSSASFKLASAMSAEISNSSTDLRVVALQNVLARHGSPLVSEAENFVKYADENNVDWKLLPAISGVESSYGIALLSGTHNAYGWGSGLIYFSSWEEGISTIDSSLRHDYIDRLGTDNVYAIGSMYAASPTWASRVSANMDEINNEYISLMSTTVKPTFE